MFHTSEDGGRLVVILDNPPVNAINDEWLKQFHLLADDLEKRTDLAVVHFRSALKVFAAGADLARLGHLTERPDGTDLMVADVAEFQRAFDRVESLPQVTVAEIGGAALGGGLELALACDLRIASTSAKLGLPEAALGLIPGAGGSQRLTWLCGRGVAARIILTADRVDGLTAERLGIVQWAFAPDALVAETEAIVRRVAGLSVAALRETKELLAAAADPARDGFHEEREADRRLFDTQDTQTRIRRFLDGNR